MEGRTTWLATLCVASAFVLVGGCKAAEKAHDSAGRSESRPELERNETLKTALKELATMTPEAPAAGDVAAAKDPQPLIGRWEIVEQLSRIGEELETRSKPGIRVYWVFRTDGSMRIEGPTVTDARYIYTGDRLLVFGLGPKQDYRIVRLDGDQLETAIGIHAGSVDIENGSVLRRKTEPAATRPSRAATDEERALAGTWVAIVDERATATGSMQGMAVADLSGDGLAEAVNRASCIWLELYENLSGFRSECAIVNGQASALAATNPLTGEKRPFGVAFLWSVEGNTVRIELESPITVPGPDGPVEAKDWHLTLPAKRGGDRIVLKESFPEHDYDLPAQYGWEFFAGSYLD